VIFDSAQTLLVYAQLGVRLLKIEVTKLEQENARLRDELKDRVLNSQPQRSGSATDDDSDLEELSLRVSGREVESPKQRASKLEKASPSQTTLKSNLNFSYRKMVDCGKRLKM